MPFVTVPMIWYVFADARTDWSLSSRTMKNCDPTELGAAVRAIADRREGMAKLTGQVEALCSKNGATSDEIDRLSVSLEEAAERAEIAVEELEMAQAEGGAEESDDAGLMDRHDRAAGIRFL